MQSNRLTLVLLVMIIFTCGSVLAQSSFGIRVGGPSQSYYFGLLDFGAIKPFVGLDYLGAGIQIENKTTYTESGEWGSYEERDEQTAEGYLRLFMPRVGLKYCRPIKNKLQTYALAEAFIVVPMVDWKSESNGDSYELSKKEKKQIKDAMDFIGITAGWGTEYFLSEQFSIGGEAGINMILWNMSDSGEDGESYGYYNNWSETYQYEVKFRIGGSFARMSINFYF